MFIISGWPDVFLLILRHFFADPTSYPYVFSQISMSRNKRTFFYISTLMKSINAKLTRVHYNVPNCLWFKNLHADTVPRCCAIPWNLPKISNALKLSCIHLISYLIKLLHFWWIIMPPYLIGYVLQGLHIQHVQGILYTLEFCQPYTTSWDILMNSFVWKYSIGIFCTTLHHILM